MKSLKLMSCRTYLKMTFVNYPVPRAQGVWTPPIKIYGNSSLRQRPQGVLVFSLKKILIVSLSVFLLASVGNIGIYQVEASSAPAGIVYSVPITLTNTQSAATPIPFQQMITMNSAAYASYEAPNLQNIEFYNSNGAVIPSWLESGNSNTSTNTIYWLKLVNGIPANSSVTVNMGFASPSTNLLSTQTTGEAPQLSSTYGEYDNGDNIFRCTTILKESGLFRVLHYLTGLCHLTTVYF